jgi:putative effector of murein hydrolase LrgA (UPF0299 family)
MRNKSIKWILLVATLIVFFFIGRTISWEQQNSIYEALRQTSALIFGIVGAWLAVLLPFSIEAGNKLKHFFDFSKKLFPALSAAIYLLFLTLFVPFIVNIIKATSCLDIQYYSILYGISFSLLALGLIILAWGLIMILASFDALKKDIELRDAATKLEAESKPPPKRHSKEL